AVQVEVEPLDPHPVRGEVARGGPAPPGLRGFAEAGGADGARGGGGEAQRDRPGAGRGGDVPLRGGAAGGGDLLAGGGGLVEVVEHEGGPGFEGETQQGARLDRGGDHDVARGEPSVQGLCELAVAAEVEAEPGAVGGLDEAQGLVRL